MKIIEKLRLLFSKNAIPRNASIKNYNLAIQHSQKGEHEQALKIYEIMAQKVKDKQFKEHLHLSAAIEASKIGDLEKTLNLLKNIENKLYAYSKIAEICSIYNNPQRASGFYQLAAKNEPNEKHSQILYSLAALEAKKTKKLTRAGWLYKRAGENNLALNAYLNAAQLKSKQNPYSITLDRVITKALRVVEGIEDLCAVGKVSYNLKHQKA